MRGRVIGRNEFLSCSLCLLRLDVGALEQWQRNLLTYFGVPKCPACKVRKMTWERYTVMQLPVIRPQPSDVAPP